jgi:hypothetical protein
MRPVLPAEEHREGREDTNRKITQATPNRIVRRLRSGVRWKPMTGACPCGGRVSEIRQSVPGPKTTGRSPTIAFAEFPQIGLLDSKSIQPALSAPATQTPQGRVKVMLVEIGFLAGDRSSA